MCVLLSLFLQNFAEVQLCVVDELEEVRGFFVGHVGLGGIMLVRMI